jgi:hypothetical protein
MPRLRNRRAFVIAVSCGIIISSSDYVVDLIFFSMLKPAIKSALMLPFTFLSLLTLLPNGVFLHKPLGVYSGWLWRTLAFLYWPVLGAIVAQRKHWLIWSALVVCLHFWVLILVIYLLRGIKLTF